MAKKKGLVKAVNHNLEAGLIEERAQKVSV